MLPLRHQKSERTFLPFAAAWTRAADRVVSSSWHDPRPIPVSEDQLPPGFGDPAQTQHLPEAPVSPIRPPGLSCVPPVLCSMSIGQGTFPPFTCLPRQGRE